MSQNLTIPRQEEMSNEREIVVREIVPDFIRVMVRAQINLLKTDSTNKVEGDFDLLATDYTNKVNQDGTRTGIDEDVKVKEEFYQLVRPVIDGDIFFDTQVLTDIPMSSDEKELALEMIKAEGADGFPCGDNGWRFVWKEACLQGFGQTQ
ncbi:Dipeptidyl peptidase family member 1 [Folsomia candida]|uniref:Dipeptidyl peptidase family member 1 n=1 Tax=Folsomia candida TaxID=158441 RepID=A0A226EM88_FOLCA|nr:Dipeptidyl peptidase family member 1 [Folsomia candida]